MTLRELVPSEDGAMVPVTLLKLKGAMADGSNPCLLFAYGAYGVSQDPSFYSPWLSLLDRGVVVAIAHVRGGGELGARWHLEGRGRMKVNGISDFVAVARYLSRSGWTDGSRLAVMGGSAGGLLVGAAINVVPEMFCACVLQVPFLDPLSSLLDPSRPLTAQEWNEWGNPARSLEDYWNIRGYSPYENLRCLDYPTTLVCAGFNDSRVSYADAAKWVQRVRELNTSSSCILLRTEMSGGHVGRSGRYNRLADEASYCAFLLHALGAEVRVVD